MASAAFPDPPSKPTTTSGPLVRVLVADHVWSSRTSTAPPVSGDIDSVLTLGLRRHYAAALSAARWVDLCDDPTYGHDQLVSMMISSLPAIADRIALHLAPGAALDIVSLGPGDGSVDCEVVRHFLATGQLRSFTGIDLSFELLRRAVRRISKVAAIPASCAVTGLWGDFTDAAAMQLVDSIEGPRLFLLTGFTIANYEEAALVQSIRSQMRAGDYLLVDARVHGGAADGPAELVRHYDSEAVRRFVFSPVELATLATVADVRFGYDVGRTLTAVERAVNIVIYCRGLDTSLRSSGARVQRDRLELAVTTLYDFDGFLAWFEAAGLRVVWNDTRAGIGLCLLERHR